MKYLGSIQTQYQKVNSNLSNNFYTYGGDAYEHDLDRNLINSCYTGCKYMGGYKK